MNEIDHSWYQNIPGLPESESAGGVVIRKDGEKIFVALVKEVGLNYMDYVLPKGHIEQGESLEQAAIREIEEETGINQLNLITKLATLERLAYDKKEWKIIHYFLFLTEQTEGKATDPDHNYAATEWFPLDNLPEFFWPEQKKLIEDNKERIIKLIKNG